MKAIKIMAFSPLMAVSAQLIGMEAPPKPAESIAQVSFDSLPADVKRLLIPMIASSKVNEVANTILALNRTNKSFHNFINSPEGMISILERMPYTANAIELGALLQKTNIPITKDTEFSRWITAAKSRLEYCDELLLAILNNDYHSLRYYLKKRNAALNCQSVTSTGKLFGPTPLILAVLERRTKMVELLLAAGANQYIKGYGGNTARDIAQEKGYQDIVDILDDYEIASSAEQFVADVLNPELEEVEPLLPPSSKKPKKNV